VIRADAAEGLKLMIISPDQIRHILTSTRTIALVGASQNPARPSYEVMNYLLSKGYRVIPVNPASAGEMLLGQMVEPSLSALTDPIDMVDIFRNSRDAGQTVDEALTLTPLPKTIWMQIGVINEEAAARARACGVEVIMDHCPKIEYARLMPRG
jgi:uncharacterized protein